MPWCASVMDVKKFSKELKKAVRRFERRCKQEGEICDAVCIGLTVNGFILETTVKTSPDDYIIASTDAEVKDGEIVLLYFEFGGMVYDF